MIPSAPAATAARAMGITLSRRPVPCDGSAMMGKCDSLCTTGMAVRSNTLRVAVSKPRMPRSHRMTSWFPSASTYSAEGTHDVILCERGIRGFDTATRNVFDLTAIPVVHKLSHLPIIADPSHGTGLRDKVIPMARAAVAAGADGIID